MKNNLNKETYRQKIVRVINRTVQREGNLKAMDFLQGVHSPWQSSQCVGGGGGRQIWQKKKKKKNKTKTLKKKYGNNLVFFSHFFFDPFLGVS